MSPKIPPNGQPRHSHSRRVRSQRKKPKMRPKSSPGSRPCWPPAPRACRNPAPHARRRSRPCRRSKSMVPTTGASGSRSGRTGEPSIGPPSSPAFVPPSVRSPPPAANATNPPSSKGPGDRALFYLDDGALDLGLIAQNVDGSEALEVQPVEAAAQLIVLPPDDGGANGPRARRISRQAKIEREVERDRDRRASPLSCSPDEFGASHPLDVGRVDHRQGARREPGVEPLVKPSEGGVGRVLVPLVAGERAAQLV